MAKNNNDLYEEDYSRNNPRNLSDTSKYDKKDIDAIKNRGTNTGEYGTSFRKREKPDDDEVEEKKSSDLGEKEKLEKDNGLKSKEKDTSSKKTDNNDSKDNNSSSLKKKLESKNPLIKLKNKILKTKLVGMAIIAALVIIMAASIISYISNIYSVIFNALTTYFGVSESDYEDGISVEDSDSFLQSDKYYIDSETGEEMSIDDVVVYLKENNTCSKSTFWNSILDKIHLIFTGEFSSVCAMLRYIEKQTSSIENTYNIKLDRSLTIASIFYGYTAQADYSTMNDPSNENIVFSGNMFESLSDALSSDDLLTQEDIDKLIYYTYTDSSYVYYTWQIDEKFRNNEETPYKITGYCKQSEAVTSIRFDMNKWNIFMRFGETAADIYESELVERNQYNSTSTECNGTVTNEELIEQIKEYAEEKYGTSSMSIKLNENLINSAREDVADEALNDLGVFTQSASTEGDQVELFNSYYRIDNSLKTYRYNIGKTIVESNGNVHVYLNYQNGFMYQRFPAFQQAINDSNYNVDYYGQATPKIIETFRCYIIEQKKYVNEILNLDDMGKSSYYNANTETSVILGAFCDNYLTAPIDQITVSVNTCDGEPIGQYSMKEYIMGVAYREVSNKEDDYVKAEMVAALTYVLRRNGNNQKGTVITIRSGNCDQAFCPMDQGCHSEPSSIRCTSSSNCTSYVPGAGSGTNTPAASSDLINLYSSYYEEIKNFLLVTGDNENLYSVSYASGLQNEWYSKASQGMSYTQIMQESYPEATLIQCTDSTSNTSSTGNGGSYTLSGNGPGEDEYKYSSTDLGSIKGFTYKKSENSSSITINPTWIENNITTINTNCSIANWNETYKVNKNVKDNYEKAFSNVCNILTNGVKISNGKTCKYNISDLTTGGTFIQRETTSGVVSDYAYGITQDWNYNKKYSINGIEYSPYNASSTIADYLEFVEAIGGNEEDCNNVNYILYKYAYKDAGFEWGRYDNSYNGMHFRISY